MPILWVALGGGLGAVLRYATVSLSVALFGDRVPYGIWLTNMLGCFVAGWVIVWVGQLQIHATEARAFILIGILGAYTTFSAFALDVLQMLNGGQIKLALAYVSLSFVACLLATVVGFQLAKQYFG